jgi:hypothetical protein
VGPEDHITGKRSEQKAPQMQCWGKRLPNLVCHGEERGRKGREKRPAAAEAYIFLPPAFQGHFENGPEKWPDTLAGTLKSH